MVAHRYWQNGVAGKHAQGKQWNPLTSNDLILTFLTMAPAGMEQPGSSPNLPPASTSLGKSPLSTSDKHKCVCMVWKSNPHMHVCVYTNTSLCTQEQECFFATRERNPSSAAQGDQEPGVQELTWTLLLAHGSHTAGHLVPAGTRALAQTLPCPRVPSFPDMHGPAATGGWSVTQQGWTAALWCPTAEPRALHWQSASQVSDRMSERHFAQVTRAESDFKNQLTQASSLSYSSEALSQKIW